MEVISRPVSVLERDEKIVNSFVKNAVESPELFIFPSQKLSSQALQVTKTLFDHAKNEEEDTIGRIGDLNELLVDGFDSEQVWQELELQNEPLYHYLNELTQNLVEEKDEVDLEETFLTGTSENEEEDEFDSGDLSDFDQDDEDDFDQDQYDDQDGDDQEMSQEPASDEEEAAAFAKMLRDKIKKGDKSDHQKQRSKKKKNPLDDDFFDFDEMAKFADEGEAGGGLLTGAGDSDEDDIYSMMYGTGEAQNGDSNDEGDDDDEEDGGFFGAKGKGKMDPEERRLEAALKKNRKRLIDDDDEDGFDDDDEEDSDIDSEEVYFEDFFKEPTKKKANRDMEDMGDLADDSDEEDEEGDEEMNMSEEDEEDDDGKMSVDQNDDEMEDENEPGLSTFEKESRERRNQIKRMEKEMMQEDERDEATMMSTGDLGVSGFEMSQRRLANKTSRLEDELVSKKKWAMLGEVSAKERGLNSLLEEDLDFEMATKAAPLITAEVTKNLEETIKRRILDRVFDDVVRRLEDAEKGDYRKRTAELDQEKSAKSLAQIYEDDYLQQTHGVKDVEKLTEAQQDCIQLFKSICRRLDGLANAQFTPFKQKEELDVVPLKDAGAIRMEEVTPITTSDATLLAPEELYKSKNRGVAKGESEWTTEEKQARRREKKKRDAKAAEKKESEERRQAQLHPERAKKKPSISEALRQIQKSGTNTTISGNTDKTHYTSTTVFQKIAEAESGKTEMPSKKKKSAPAPSYKL